VIAWATASYAGLARGLRVDCRRLGYPFHLYEVDAEYPLPRPRLVQHPAVMRRGVEEFGTVLFLDVECRIVAPIPAQWRPPRLRSLLRRLLIGLRVRTDWHASS
jgi:hypothetical protein